jgi:hypothetical protein
MGALILNKRFMRLVVGAILVWWLRSVRPKRLVEPLVKKSRLLSATVSTPLGYPEGLQCTEVPLTDFEADIFQAAVAQVLQFSTVIMAFPAK